MASPINSNSNKTWSKLVGNSNTSKTISGGSGIIVTPGNTSSNGTTTIFSGNGSGAGGSGYSIGSAYGYAGTYNLTPDIITSDAITTTSLNVTSDITFQGKSLIQTLDKIQEQLAIINVREDLEEKWTSLKEIRNRYEELLKEIIEQETTFNTLKNAKDNE